MQGLARHGKELRIRDAEGLFAQVLQHEIDHLDGRLYVDRLLPDTFQRAEPLRKREADAREARRAAGEIVDDDEDEAEPE